MAQPESGPGRKAVRKQIVLPLGKSLEISFKSIRVRLLRSLITVCSLTLAVSFLAYVLVSLDAAAGLLASGGDDAAKMLQQAGYDVDAAQGVISMSAKERWIILLSLLVCTVGIVNAQLMAVTERFREIGVMKCLGALDSMVLRLFLLESMMQGAAGAAAGALLGAVFALLHAAARFGLDAWWSLPGAGVLASLGIAVASGVALSMLGVLYPAVVAARMRPVMALRAEL